jgi:hypothetical protein
MELKCSQCGDNALMTIHTMPTGEMLGVADIDLGDYLYPFVRLVSDGAANLAAPAPAQTTGGGR